ncbi:hypothetical protein ABZ307_39295 [Streptomyces griseorubiginosus]|uniref:hypothetical protein n=1 Tax=Streptomyces griseorubiginosus TaxID=67304 RepID=UPI0033A839C0
MRAIFQSAAIANSSGSLVTAGLLDVTTVVLGGGVSRAWHLLAPAVHRALAAEPPVSGQELRVLPALLGGDAVAVGAAARVRTELGGV